MKFTLLFISILLFPQESVFGQEVRTFEGIISLDNIAGTSSFQYLVNQKDTIKHKQFTFQSSHADPITGQWVSGISFNGAYNKGFKNGKWQYGYKELEPVGEMFISNYQLINRANGKEFTISADFLSGQPNGKWQVVRQSIKNSQPTDTSFYASAHFAEGKMTGSMESKTQTASFLGQVNSKGLVDGEWILTQLDKRGEKITERRVYEGGVLKKHFFELQGQQVLLSQTESESQSDLEEMSLGKEYFNVLYYTYLWTDSPTAKEEVIAYLNTSNDFLSETLLSFENHKNRKVWKILEGSESIQYPVVRVRKYPYAPGEKTMLNETSDLLLQTNKILGGFFENPQVEISKYAYSDIAFYYQVMKQYEKNLKNISRAQGLFTDSTFKYIDREEVFGKILSDFNSPDSVRFEFENKTITRHYQFPQNVKKDGSNSEAVNAKLKLIYQDIMRIQEKINPVLEKHKKQGKLTEKEEILVRKKDSIIALYENISKSEIFNTYHQKTAGQIIAYTHEVFKEYGATPLESKIESIDGVLECYDEIIYLFDKQAKLPKMKARIDELYTRTVWNPYTFSDMDERVKEKLYQAYDLHIFNFLLKDLELNILCGKIKTKADNFDILYKKMISLREEDTKEIEKQIRRNTSVEEIIQLLNLKFG